METPCPPNASRIRDRGGEGVKLPAGFADKPK